MAEDGDPKTHDGEHQPKSRLPRQEKGGKCRVPKNDQQGMMPFQKEGQRQEKQQHAYEHERHLIRRGRHNAEEQSQGNGKDVRGEDFVAIKHDARSNSHSSRLHHCICLRRRDGFAFGHRSSLDAGVQADTQSTDPQKNR